jgi:class III poly(R)-hydroxyalkanoic acid synthase PhaE subunit
MTMADNPFDPTRWTGNLQKAQADLMSQWSLWNGLWAQTARGAGLGATMAAAPGAAVPGAGPSAGGAWPMAAQFEQYLGITRSLWELLGRTASIGDGTERVKTFNEGLTGLQSQFASMFMPGGANPWQSVAQGLTPNMTNPFGGLPMFGMPALGPGREQQESWQRLTAATMRYAQAQARLAAQWNEIVAAGLRQLGKQLSPGLQTGQLPGSMKELYDSWVDAAESSYGHVAHGAAFIQAQAEVGNAIAELRLAQREILEDWARQFDLPSRAELNTLHKQVRELSAEVKRLGG